MFKISPAMQKLRHGLFCLCSSSAVPALGWEYLGWPCTLPAWPVSAWEQNQCPARAKALKETQPV